MMDAGTRPRSRTCLALTLVLGLTTSACQSAMSIEEAKKVTADFGGASFVPPPRTINDITAILDKQKRFWNAEWAKANADLARGRSSRRVRYQHPDRLPDLMQPGM